MKSVGTITSSPGPIFKMMVPHVKQVPLLNKIACFTSKYFFILFSRSKLFYHTNLPFLITSYAALLLLFIDGFNRI